MTRPHHSLGAPVSALVYRASLTWNDDILIGHYDFGDYFASDVDRLNPSHLLLMVRTRAHDALVVRCSVVGRSFFWHNTDHSDGEAYKVATDFMYNHPDGVLVTETQYPGSPGSYLVFYIDDAEEGYTPISISHLSSAWLWKGCEVNRVP